MFSQSWRLGESDNALNRFYFQLRSGVNRQISEWLARNAFFGNDLMVLEAGCGLAEGSQMLAANPDVRLGVALDLDPEALKLAREQSFGVSLVRGDLFRLPFKPGAFDLVWNNSTFEHFPDRRTVVAEMTRVVKGGGRVFIGVPYRGGLLFFQRWIARTGFGEWIGQVFNRETLAVEMEDAGLTLEKFATFYFKIFIGCLARKG